MLEVVRSGDVRPLVAKTLEAYDAIDAMKETGLWAEEEAE